MILAFVCMLVLFHSTTSEELIAGYNPKDLQDICGTPTYCLTVVATDGGNIVIDELEYETNTVKDLARRIPSWFGPHPAEFVHGSFILEEDKSFEYYKIKPASKVTMRPKPTQNSDL
eukprot:PhF_6_TR20333/c0_g1_i1/m.29323